MVLIVFNRNNHLKHIGIIGGVYTTVLSSSDIQYYLDHSEELEESFAYLLSEEKSINLYLLENEDSQLRMLLEEVFEQHKQIEHLLRTQMDLLLEKMRVTSSATQLSVYSPVPYFDAAFFDKKG